MYYRSKACSAFSGGFHRRLTSGTTSYANYEANSFCRAFYCSLPRRYRLNLPIHHPPPSRGLYTRGKSTQMTPVSTRSGIRNPLEARRVQHRGFHGLDKDHHGFKLTASCCKSPVHSIQRVSENFRNASRA